MCLSAKWGEAAVLLDETAIAATLTQRSKGEQRVERMPLQTRGNGQSLGAAAALPQRWGVSGSQPEFTLQKTC